MKITIEKMFLKCKVKSVVLFVFTHIYSAIKAKHLNNINNKWFSNSLTPQAPRLTLPQGHPLHKII